jgi:hypothetical protein
MEIRQGILFEPGGKVFVKVGSTWSKGRIEQKRESPAGIFLDVKLDSGVVGTFHRNYVKLAE